MRPLRARSCYIILTRQRATIAQRTRTNQISLVFSVTIDALQVIVGDTAWLPSIFLDVLFTLICYSLTANLMIRHALDLLYIPLAFRVRCRSLRCLDSDRLFLSLDKAAHGLTKARFHSVPCSNLLPWVKRGTWFANASHSNQSLAIDVDRTETFKIVWPPREHTSIVKLVCQFANNHGFLIFWDKRVIDRRLIAEQLVSIRITCAFNRIVLRCISANVTVYSHLIVCMEAITHANCTRNSCVVFVVGVVFASVNELRWGARSQRWPWNYLGLLTSHFGHFDPDVGVLQPALELFNLWRWFLT